MTRFLLVLFSLFLIVNADEYRGPVILWSNSQDIEFPSNGARAADISSLIDSTQHFLNEERVAIAFVDKKFTSDRATNSYKALTSVLAELPVHKSWEFSNGHLSAQQMKTLTETSIDDFPQPNKISLIDVSNEENPGLAISNYLSQLNTPYVAFVGSPLMEEASRRRLQPAPTRATVPYIHLDRHELPSLLYMLIFAGLLLIAVSCLSSVDGPVSFEDKVLTVNREF